MKKGQVECICTVRNWAQFSRFWHGFRDHSVINCRSSGTETEARGVLGARKCLTRIEAWRQSFLGKTMP
jgi:hypothetical protein